MNGPQQLKDAFAILNGIGSATFDYAVFAATVGTIVMALLELVKAVTYARRRFHEYEMRRWVEREARYSALDIFRFDGTRGSECWREFLELLTGGYATKRAVFDQPVERLMAQIQAVTNMTLDFPERYPHMFRFLTGHRPDRGSPSAGEQQISDAHLWAKAAALRREGAKPAESDAGKADEALRAGAEARARLQNLVARQLDALQTEVHYRWSRANQLIATSSGAVLTFFALVAAQGTSKPELVPVFIAMSLLAGLTSPFAKDVVSGLSGFARQVKG